MDKNWKIEFRKQFVNKDKDFGQKYIGGSPVLLETFIDYVLQKQRAKTIKHIVLETGKRYEVMTLNGKHVSYITLAVLENVLESI